MLGLFANLKSLFIYVDEDLVKFPTAIITPTLEYSVWRRVSSGAPQDYAQR